MIRLFQIVGLLAAGSALVACAETGPTEPRAASAVQRDVVNASKPLPSISCTVTQVDATHFDATVAWRGTSVFEIQFFQGTTLLATSQFTRPKKSGSVTLRLGTAPDNAVVGGNPVGAKVLCLLS
jgi:hypothetical protein